MDGVEMGLRTTGSEMEVICFLELSTLTAAGQEMSWLGEGFRMHLALF